MSNIVDLGSRKSRELEVWRCNCGSHTFWLYSDHSAVCSECEQEALDVNGFWRLPNNTHSVPNHDRINIIPIRNGNCESDQ
jgi:hypothetical protein